LSGVAPNQELPKIAVFLPSLDGGGAERVFAELSGEFAALGYAVDLVLASARGPYLAEVSTSVRVVDLGAAGVLASLPSLVRYLRLARPCVMLSGLDHANVVGILACIAAGGRTRCVISMRSVPTAVRREDRSMRGWLVFQLTKVMYRFADGVIGNSSAVVQDLARFRRLAAGKAAVIYNPLDINRIERASLAKVDHPWLADGAAPVVLGVGSLAVLKDFPTLIRAFSLARSHCNCRLVILGEGPDRPALERLVRELELDGEVLLPGFVANPFAWMKHARVFVSSSLTEGCPNALMQSLACGTPVVSTACPGGSAEILENGKWGRLVPVRNADAMAEAIIASIDSASPPNVRQRAADFALDSIARQYLRFLLPRQDFAAAERPL
jgi:glycosyltransferase involved in cell wall biosynthesis